MYCFIAAFCCKFLVVFFFGFFPFFCTYWRFFCLAFSRKKFIHFNFDTRAICLKHFCIVVSHCSPVPALPCPAPPCPALYCCCCLRLLANCFTSCVFGAIWRRGFSISQLPWLRLVDLYVLVRTCLDLHAGPVDARKAGTKKRRTRYMPQVENSLMDAP